MPRMEATEPQRRDGSVHDAGVEFDHALFVRQPAVSDGSVLGIEFVDVDAGDDGIERIAARLEDLHGAGAGAQPVLARDHDRARTRLRRTASCSGEQCRPRQHGTACESGFRWHRYPPSCPISHSLCLGHMRGDGSHSVGKCRVGRRVPLGNLWNPAGSLLR